MKKPVSDGLNKKQALLLYSGVDEGLPRAKEKKNHAMISEGSNKGAAIIKLRLYFSGCKYTTSHVPNEQRHSFFFG